MRKIITVEWEKCISCLSCMVACSYEHTGMVNPARSRIRVDLDWERGAGFPVLCQQCEDAPCIASCPVEALKKNPITGVVEYHEEKCIGCKQCVLACPFGAMIMDPATHLPMKCNHCDGDPACVKICPEKVLVYVEESLSSQNKHTKTAYNLITNPKEKKK
ncbi:MAG: 4Fe-4S dicluster domain-containing protein [Candidatus Ranarchaeia archaeon]